MRLIISSLAAEISIDPDNRLVVSITSIHFNRARFIVLVQDPSPQIPDLVQKLYDIYLHISQVKKCALSLLSPSLSSVHSVFFFNPK